MRACRKKANGRGGMRLNATFVVFRSFFLFYLVVCPLLDVIKVIVSQSGQKINKFEVKLRASGNIENALGVARVRARVSDCLWASGPISSMVYVYKKWPAKKVD